MLFAGWPAFFNARWSLRSVGLVLAVVLVATGLAFANAQGATAQSADQSAAERCSEFHLFGAEPVDVAKSGDGQTVLAQVSWGYHGSIGCYLTLDDDAVDALRAAGPPTSLPQGQTDDSRRCFEHHRFGEEPVDVAKTTDGQTVLARLSWGYHDSISCFLALDSAAINTLRAAEETPDVPTDLTATAGNGQIAVSWNAPADTGGAPITVYTLAYKATTSGCPITLDATWTVRTISNAAVSIAGLTNGTNYRLCVKAANTAGDSDWAGTSATPATTPGAPGNVEAAAGDGQLTVTWTAPSNNGGAPIIDYTVAYQASATACPTDIDATWNPRITSETSATIGGLANGTAYRVCVKATNTAGDSPWNAASATPATSPGAPTNVEATAGDGQLTVSWTAPSNNGGASITSYTVAYQANAFTCPATADDTWARHTTSNTSITIGDLANNNAYRLCVRASNSAGDGTWSGTSSSPSDRPGPPTGVQFLSSGPDQLTVAWIAPAATGASAITGYTVQWCTAGATNDVCASSWSTASATGTSYTIAGLDGSTSYGVRVQAANSRGTGPWSNTRFASTTAATPPGTPSGLAASVDDRQIALRWNAPSANGAPIVVYTVECRLGGTAIATGNCGSSTYTRYSTVSGTSTTISGLANGTAYDIRVRAANRAGSSAWATISATPAARPRVPANVVATASGRNIQVTWTAPASGGAPITRYTVQSCSGGCTSWRSTTVSGNPPATTATISGLATGTTYRVRVRAVNSAGESGWSASDTATTPTRPGTPTGVTITTIGRGELTAIWTAPVSVSGVSHYNVQRCRATARSDGTWVCSSGWSNAGTATDTTHMVTGLNGNTAYSVRVQAANAAGTSGWSNTYTATTEPPDPPETPSGLTAAPGNRLIRLSWTAPAANGARITRYTITCTSGLTGNHRCDNTEGNNTYTTGGTSYTISGLTNGNEYTFTVSATNSAGSSSTTSISDTPATRPGRPSDIEITESYPGGGGVNLAITWTGVAAEDNGGTDITGYTVQYRASGGNWSFVYFGTDTSTSVEGLTVGPRYYVQIRAHNTVGESSWVQASSDPTGTPAKPATPTISGIERGQLTVNWTAPAQGASEITDYDVQWCTARERTVTTSGVDTITYPCTSSWRTAADDDIDADSTSYTIAGLAGRTSYSVRVRAVNIHGNGPWSDVGTDSFGTTNPPIAPEAPTAPTANAGNRQIRLSWTAPEANGARITRYTIECTSSNEGNHRCDGTRSDGTANTNNTYTTSGTAYPISGLTNGVEYSFRVLATNSEGNSSYSSSTTATPASRPDRPDPDDITITETYADGSVTLGVSWLVPDNTGGHPEGITGYTVQYRSSGGNWSFHYFGTDTSTDITGLIVGRRYDVQIRTHTAAGESSWAQKSVTPTGRPGAPSGVSVTQGTNELTVTWSPPTATGASDISGYNVQRCNARETERTVDGNATLTYSCTSGWSSAGTTAVDTTTLTIGNLSCGTRFGVRVQAVNSYGSGPWSDISRDSATWSSETSAC